MLNIFKIIDYGMKARQGYNAPDELLADTSFGLIEGFFIVSFIILGILSGGLLYLGFTYGYLILKIFGFLFVGVLIIDISLYRVIKRTIGTISKKVTQKVQEEINQHRIMDAEVLKNN